ncbi:MULTISPECIES: spondin domain-containing protein [Vibrio]|uniref:spondin domain-containing protein n=1 Tax=Vibrio TaxID=662 RepID=UPI0003F618FF|nr:MULTISPECIES: spondin domain-containing protein [Vibrio]EKO3811366.1 spondin domain-containing protein [Vibrio harveyi]EKO3826042.1 spondin domain-containing protein [Vibrio harveyi]EKO3869601.1 spondin domain-containing protein [Vibrio harveyi]ELH7811870.1 spondin domain-containing protein [Vibrio harveyi]ELV8772942.1 spondin domain-containing protein [Vibrio harveyi]
MKYRILLVAASVGLLAGCPSDDDNDVVKSYRYTINVANLTANQPMSPLAILAHNDKYKLFEIGKSASVELEHLAEGGSNAELLALKDSNDYVYQTLSGNGLVLPGSSDSVTFTVDPHKAGYVSVASMFVNTNDAFVGETGLSLKSLAVGESYEMSMNVWDSGTELNDELAATIPGPAGGGEGFNATRNDTNDVVAFHAGVVSKDDGLANSALSANHRFLNPGAKLTITRVE